MGKLSPKAGRQIAFALCWSTISQSVTTHPERNSVHTLPNDRSTSLTRNDAPIQRAGGIAIYQITGDSRFNVTYAVEGILVSLAAYETTAKHIQ